MGVKHSSWVILAAGLAGWFAPACGSEENVSSLRVLDASVVLLELPSGMGRAERPAVEFKHGLHTKALEHLGCKTCHVVGDKQIVRAELNWPEVPKDSRDWMDAYHAFCLGCHQEKTEALLAEAPIDCGLCHIKRGAGLSGRAPMRMSASLHARHIKAEKDRCESCHHFYDEKSKKLMTQPGTESNCSHCHHKDHRQGRDIISNGKQLSYREAAHLGCVNCHIRRSNEGKESGPWLCDGCHDRDEQTKFATLDPVPRLQRDQPDLIWLDASTSKISPVPFDHKSHETFTAACSDCHHNTLEACSTCHPTRGDKRGEGITLEQAYHQVRSRMSCVGCHNEQLEKRVCAGCHGMLSREPGRDACKICHPLADDSGKMQDDLKKILAPPAWPALPNPSDDFPDKIGIDKISDQYAAADFPHRRIVLALDRIVRENKLAMRFHLDNETMCAGCHHHNPKEARFLACSACHSEKSHPVKDLPNLTQAYHRQCIGCHQRMDHPAQECEDCHKIKSKEVSP